MSAVIALSWTRNELSAGLDPVAGKRVSWLSVGHGSEDMLPIRQLPADYSRDRHSLSVLDYSWMVVPGPSKPISRL